MSVNACVSECVSVCARVRACVCSCVIYYLLITDLPDITDLGPGE